MIDGIQITVEVDDEGRPVVVKTAGHDEAAAVLAREAERLARARHPGVVEVVEAGPGRLVLAWAGSHTLETLTPTAEVAATLVAALAATVSDLHGLGVVHGRISPAHVVVDEQGRPRLCGLRGPDDERADPGPADDVAALGRLIDHLLGTDADAEPIPEHRWPRKRWTGYQRRALLTLADQATDPDPARRPTARVLAAAIAEVVPEAHFERPAISPAVTHGPDRATDADLATDPDPATRADPATDADPEPGPDPDGGTTDAYASGAADAAVAGSSGETGDLDPMGDGDDDPARSARGPSPDPDWDDLWDRLDPGPGEPERFLGLRLEPSGSEVPPPPARPAPSRAAVSDPRSTRLRRVPGPAAAATGLLAVAALVVLAWPRPAPAPSPELLPAPAPAPATPTTTPTTTSAPSGPIELEGNLIHVGDRWFEAGRAGDRVAVGDWDCDGTATPAVVRPATGEVFVFDRWASEGGDVTVEARGRVPSAVALEPSPGGGCHPPIVRLADGTTRALAITSRRPR